MFRRINGSIRQQFFGRAKNGLGWQGSWLITLSLVLVLSSLSYAAESYSTFDQRLSSQNFAFNIYKVNSLFYPFVQCYFRTFDLERNPLANVNELNVALMVKGRVYDPFKKQYYVQTRRERREGFRTVIVLDCSKTMAGQPFQDAVTAIKKYIKFKKPTDQIAILAVKDKVIKISDFEDDDTRLLLRLADCRPDGETTVLFDGINQAYEMCAFSSSTDSTAMGADGTMNFLIGNSIAVFSDGKDEGSNITIENVIARIERFFVPIYSVGYTKIDPKYLKNLGRLSDVSLGKYWYIKDAREYSRVVEQIYDINNRDYVLTFRAYLEPDGEQHAVKIGIKYDGKINYSSQKFEAVEIPPDASDQVRRIFAGLNDAIPPLADKNPYYEKKADITKTDQ